MAKVIDKYKVELENYFDNDETVGECSNCGSTVHKSRQGCDEICPRCGEWLDWDVEEDIDNDIDDFFMDEWGCE